MDFLNMMETVFYEEKRKSLTKMLVIFKQAGENIEDIGVQKDAAIQCGFNLNDLSDADINSIVRKVLSGRVY